MKTLKITKLQLDTLLNVSNPTILHPNYIDDGDLIICEENNSKYLVIDASIIGCLDYDLKDCVELKAANNTIDLYDWEKARNNCFPDDIHFTKIVKLEQVLSSKEIDLNLLEGKK